MTLREDIERAISDANAQGFELDYHAVEGDSHLQKLFEQWTRRIKIGQDRYKYILSDDSIVLTELGSHDIESMYVMGRSDYYALEHNSQTVYVEIRNLEIDCKIPGATMWLRDCLPAYVLKDFANKNQDSAA